VGQVERLHPEPRHSPQPAVQSAISLSCILDFMHFGFHAFWGRAISSMHTLLLSQMLYAYFVYIFDTIQNERFEQHHTLSTPQGGSAAVAAAVAAALHARANANPDLTSAVMSAMVEPYTSMLGAMLGICFAINRRSISRETLWQLPLVFPMLRIILLKLHAFLS
jgi:hypothetical protein